MGRICAVVGRREHVIGRHRDGDGALGNDDLLAQHVLLALRFPSLAERTRQPIDAALRRERRPTSG